MGGAPDSVLAVLCPTHIARLSRRDSYDPNHNPAAAPSSPTRAPTPNTPKIIQVFLFQHAAASGPTVACPSARPPMPLCPPPHPPPA